MKITAMRLRYSGNCIMMKPTHAIRITPAIAAAVPYTPSVPVIEPQVDVMGPRFPVM
jgi:hypothetical protein